MPQWSLNALSESVTRGIELLDFSIPYHIRETSEYGDLTDLLIQPTPKPDKSSDEGASSINLESIKAEHARRIEAGAFEHNISLANRWAKPEPKLSDEELANTLSKISSEWEQDLDDLFRDD